MIGQTISNYRIVEQIGRGGMGVVYKALDQELDRPVAIKMLPPELATDPQLIERFRSEAKAQATLNHSNITGLYTLLPYGENYFMVMEYVSGQTIAEIIRQTGPIPYQKAIPWLKQALLGIGLAHRRGIIHRDIKPNNLMVTDDGLVKVMDFGIARVVGGRRLTGTGILVGTLPYMSPEQVMGEDPDLRSDIYSLGVTLYEMVTGRLPFESQSDFHLMKEIVEAPAPPPRQFYPYVSEALQMVILKALEKNPGSRYQSVEELGAALEAVEHGIDIGLSPTNVVVGMTDPAVMTGQSSSSTTPRLSVTSSAPVAASEAYPSPLPDERVSTEPLSTWQRLIQNPTWLIAGGVALLLLVLVGSLAYWPSDPIAPATGAQQGQGTDRTTEPPSDAQTSSGELPDLPGLEETDASSGKTGTSPSSRSPRPSNVSSSAPAKESNTAATSSPPSRSNQIASPSVSPSATENPAPADANARSSGEKDAPSGSKLDKVGNTAEKVGDAADKVGDSVKKIGGWFKGGNKKKESGQDNKKKEKKP